MLYSFIPTLALSPFTRRLCRRQAFARESYQVWQERGGQTDRETHARGGIHKRQRGAGGRSPACGS